MRGSRVVLVEVVERDGLHEMKEVAQLTLPAVLSRLEVSADGSHLSVGLVSGWTGVWELPEVVAMEVLTEEAADHTNHPMVPVDEDHEIQPDTPPKPPPISMGRPLLAFEPPSAPNPTPEQQQQQQSDPSVPSASPSTPSTPAPPAAVVSFAPTCLSVWRPGSNIWRCIDFCSVPAPRNQEKDQEEDEGG
ncbi:unnamed protein product, partial [Chrysoparadoxa australica]